MKVKTLCQSFSAAARQLGKVKHFIFFCNFRSGGKLLLALFAAALKLPSFQRYFCLLALSQKLNAKLGILQPKLSLPRTEATFPCQKKRKPERRNDPQFPTFKRKTVFQNPCFSLFLPGHFFHVPSSQRFFFNQPTSQPGSNLPSVPFLLPPPSFPPRRI